MLIFAEDSTYSKEDGQKDTTFPNELVSSVKPYYTLLGSNLLFQSNYLVLCEYCVYSSNIILDHVLVKLMIKPTIHVRRGNIAPDVLIFFHKIEP